MVTVFLYLLYFLSYDVINDVIMTDADCTPGREPRIVATSSYVCVVLHVAYRFGEKATKVYLCAHFSATSP